MKRKILSGLLSLVMLLTVLAGTLTVYAADANFQGEGTADIPFLISTADDLVKLADLTNAASTAETYASKYYQLTQDIDMTGVSYQAISYATGMHNAKGASFKGTLDGNNHIIKNVTFKQTSDYGATYGIIGYLSSGTVKNLGVENMVVNAGTISRACIGGIAGTLATGMTIENSYVRGMTVSVAPSGTDKTTYVGGIAGRNVGGSGTIKNCYAVSLNFSGVTITNNTAGILGASANAAYIAENCYTTHGKVQGNTAATNGGMKERNCYKSSTIADATVEALGNSFKADSRNKNSGYPLLFWEVEASFDGLGTEESPYLINDANDLVKLATLTNNSKDKTAAAEYASKYYQLTQDIDMTGVSYQAISYATSMYTAQGASFTGTLDGNNHIIKNVTFKQSPDYGTTYGIIGYLSSGTVKNLGVENMTVSAGGVNRICVGGIAGSLGTGMTIENSYVKGMTVTSTSADATYVGGIAGRTVGDSGTIKNCYSLNLNFGGVSRSDLKAGILGSSGNNDYTAENCYTTDAKIQGNTSVTGSGMKEYNCYKSSTIADATAETLNKDSENPAFKADSKGCNNGYPLLSWEAEKAAFTGEGTSESPYLINNASDLTKLADLTNKKVTAEHYASQYYQLTQDIDMTGVSYKAISWAGNYSEVSGASFKGTLDGNNHVIKNITFKQESTYGATYGIIGYLSGGTVKNLGVENMTVDAGTASRFAIGGIAGALGAGMTIENSYVKGMTVAAAPSGTDKTTYVGGIAGRTVGNSGTIKNSYTLNLNFSGIPNANTAAGILGSCGNTAYTAENCYTTYSKVQGNTSATNTYMKDATCYASSKLATLTAATLGSAFKADSKGCNNGYPLLSWEAEKAAFQGEGTAEKPYLINNAGDLTKLADLTNKAVTAEHYASQYYQLTADIDMTGVEYTSISYAKDMHVAQGKAFTGTLDGNKHIIKNVTFKQITTGGSTYGIIGYLGANGVVKNLGVENVTVDAGAISKACIGGIIGSINANVTIENSYVKGMKVTSTSTEATYVGGIVGRTIGNSGVIKNSYAITLDFSTVTNKNTVAGILGSCGNTDYSAENCYTTYSKVQGNASATNSYMEDETCYAASALATLTAEALGSAFKEDLKGNNNGYPLLSWETENEPFQGEGTEESPYLINNASDLTKLALLTNKAATAETYANKYYQLTQDIDMAGVSYTAISYASNMSTAQGKAFTGTLDGNNYVIKNVTFKQITTGGSTYGIIGYLGTNGVVKNLGVENVTVDAGAISRACIGGIVGSINANVTIENSYVKGMKVTSTSTEVTYVGGIVGRTIGNSGVIKNSYAIALDFSTVTNKSTVAGILGSSGSTGYSAENCYTTYAKVQGNASATNSYMHDENCYATTANATDLGLSFISVDSINEGKPALVWEYEVKNPTASKKTVTVNKAGEGSVTVVGAGEVETSFTAYSEQGVSFSLYPAEAYTTTKVSYCGNILYANNGKYSFKVNNGGELKLVFTEISDGDVELYVSLTGDDNNDGTSVGTAFKTFKEALNAAKAYNGTKVINIEDGVYNIEEAIALDSDDSNIILRAMGDNVVLNGGKKIEKTWFNETDNANILVADLKANGITEFGRIKSVGYGTYADSADKNGAPVFTIDGEYQVPARYPNSGYIKTSQIVTGSESTENLSFKTSDSHVSNWVNEKDAWVFGYFKNDWADAILPVTVDDSGVISANDNSHYGATSGSRFYVFNALCELDAEGEYYIDRENGLMYIFKPSNWDSVENMVFSAGDNNIIEINGAKNVTLEGLKLTNTNAYGLMADDADGLTVKDCDFNSTGRFGMYVVNSDNATIEGNTVKNTGFVGILYNKAGDRETLTSSNTTIQNNTVTKTGRERQASAYAIDISNTVGVVVSGNTIFDLPHGAILYNTCNDADIFYNEIYDVIKDTSDAGAIYSGRDWTTRGNEVKYNYIHDIPDINGNYNASAVYLDDMHSSTEVQYNVIYNVPQAILLGGGRNNTFTNNLIIDCDRWIEADRRGVGADLSYMKHMLSQVPYQSEAWAKYSNLANILDDEPEEAKYNIIKDNVTYNSSGANFQILNSYIAKYEVGNPINVTTDFFYSYNNKEFAFSENAKTINATAYNLIKDIPFAKMGFQVIVPSELVVENVMLTEDGSNLVASYQISDTTTTPAVLNLIIAQYVGNRLEVCEMKEIKVGLNAGAISDTFTVLKDSDATSYKVFLWDTNLCPLWND